jgi:ribosomal protein S18 acetylase RimI-like enzyme
MNIKIRKAIFKDVDTIFDLWLLFRDNHKSIIIKNNNLLMAHQHMKKNSEKIFRKYLRKHLSSNDAYVQLAFVDGKVAGYNLNYIQSSNPVFVIDKTGYISDLFVKKEYRGLGISTRFKENAFKFFKKKGLEYASIKVWNANNDAHKIYKNWGFAELHVEMRKRL